MTQNFNISGERYLKKTRVTSESNIDIELNLDGSGYSEISTSVPFFDHMLTALAKHSLIDLRIKASGDTHIDIHHTVEDTGILLGAMVLEALGNKAGIVRYADAKAPLDEALAEAVIDISGRPYLVHSGEPEGFEYHLIGGHFTGSMVRHFFEAFVLNSRITAHITLISGRDAHHIAEAQFKAFARALREAISFDNRVSGVPSTKGVL